jgi:hypothetical protein
MFGPPLVAEEVVISSRAPLRIYSRRRKHKHGRATATMPANFSWQVAPEGNIGDRVSRSTKLWISALLLSFFVAMGFVAFGISLGLHLRPALGLGTQVWAALALLWTVVAIARGARIYDRLVPVPSSVRSLSGPPRGWRATIRIILRPAAIVLTWMLGGFFIWSALVTPLYLEAEGDPPPFALVAVGRWLFLAVAGALLTALCIGPTAFLIERALRKDDELHEMIVVLDAAVRTQIGDQTQNSGAHRNQLRRQLRRRSAMLNLWLGLYLAVIGAVIGTIAGYLLSAFVPPERFYEVFLSRG